MEYPLRQFWDSPLSCPALPRDAVHVWSVELDLPLRRVMRYALLLSPDEQARAARFRFREHRRRFVVAHGVLRCILAAYLADDPLQLRFRCDPRSKPGLIEPAGSDWLSFNLSHSAGVALIAVAHGREVGVDVERMRQVDQVDSIAEHHFCVSEREAVCITPEERKSDLFFAYWTRKEALLKATGDGILTPLNVVDVSDPPRSLLRLLKVRDGCRLRRQLAIQDLKPAVGYAGALAVEGDGWQLACWRWTE
jgi:4'-phosphopantetheinyl transferase